MTTAMTPLLLAPTPNRNRIPAPTRTPSPYQTAILHAVQHHTHSITVNATAGSGKTTLIQMIATLLDEQHLVQPGQPVGVLSFNTHIVKPLRKLVPKQFDVRTVSSLGHLICTKNLPKLTFKPEKYTTLITEHLQNSRIASPATRQELRERLNATLNLHVGHGLGLDTSLSDWAEQLNDVDAPILGAEDTLYQLTHRILRQGLHQLQQHHVISFLDQVLAPTVFGWRLPDPYAFLLVDELQDLSRAQLTLLQAATNDASRLIGVGDEHQSLYAFNGADAHSMQRFTELFHATPMPLSISYRCPTRHVELARPYTSAIEAAPHATGGTLDDLTGEEFEHRAQPGHLALCRTNAPLIDWCYRLTAAGVPALVRGRDLSRSLIVLARDAATWDGQKARRDQVSDGLSLSTFTSNLNAYADHLARHLTREAERDGRDPDLRLAGLADRITALNLVRERSQAQTLGELTAAIRALFQGDPEKCVVLSTVHRAKGLEVDTVYILAPELLPHPSANTPQAEASETCAQFVAFTRSKRALYFVDVPQTRIPEHLRATA
jgi:DNA helicase-2/ATP-dependent DNA helicase PcrA